MPTVPSRLRLFSILLGGLVTAILPLSFPDDGGPTGFDRVVKSLDRSMLSGEALPRAFLVPAQLYVLIPVVSAGVVYFVVRSRSLSKALTLVLAPVLAVLATEDLLKPLFGRHLHSAYIHRTFLDYPSGSTVALTSVTTAFVVVIASCRVRVAVIALGALAVTALALALVWFDFHHITDVIGAVGFAVATVLAIDALIRISAESEMAIHCGRRLGRSS